MVDIINVISSRERNELQIRSACRRSNNGCGHLVKELFYPRQQFRWSLVFDSVFRTQPVRHEAVTVELDGDIFRHQLGEILPDNPQCTGMKSRGLFYHKLDQLK